MRDFTTEDLRNLILAAWMVQAGLTIVCSIAVTANSLIVISVHAVWAAIVTIACSLWRKHLMQKNNE